MTTETRLEIQDDGSTVTSTTTTRKEPIYKAEQPKTATEVFLDGPIPKLLRVEKYGPHYYIKRWSELGQITVCLSPAAIKSGKKLHTAFSGGRFTDLKSAREAIDKIDGKQATQTETIYSTNSDEFVNYNYDGDTTYGK